MNKTFETPEISVLTLVVEDVVATSGELPNETPIV